MSFNDIIKKSVLETMGNSTMSMVTICVAVAMAIIFSLYIYMIYFLSQKKSFYNKQFNIVLGVLPVITAGIILAMQSNLIISLGMVGALSIVRFRTAVKEPKDLVFLFWSISIGIMIGALNYELALIISLAVTLLLFLLELLPSEKWSVLLVVNMSLEGTEDELLAVVREFVKRPLIKSRNRTMAGTDYIVECRTAQEKELQEAVSGLNHVTGVSVIAHDGMALY